MNLNFDVQEAASYKSPSQRARVLTESWVGREIYCPNCGCPTLDKLPNNSPVADFSCLKCREQFELKSKRDAFGNVVVDGEYATMISRLSSSTVPNLITLRYNSQPGQVRDLVVIPNQFFVPAIIARRKPLAPTAKRAGWVGCNILIGKIPNAGRVKVVEAGVSLPKSRVLAAWKRTLFLREQRQLEARGWALDVMHCIEQFGKPEFTLADVYRCEDRLSRLHARNRHVRAKIRQQLQILRDAGLLEFSARGRYRMI